MLLVVATAAAHPSFAAHVHPDPAVAASVVVPWVLAAGVWAVFAARGRRAPIAQRSSVPPSSPMPRRNTSGGDPSGPCHSHTP